MSEPTLFDPGPPDPKNDAAPLAGGAGVNKPDTSPKSKPKHPRPSPALRRNAPDTSREAARRIAGHTGTQRAAVLAFIASCGTAGATDPEIAAGVGIPIQSVNPRRGELEDRGVIMLNGERRPSPSGHPCRVWVAVEHAPKADQTAKRGEP